MNCTEHRPVRLLLPASAVPPHEGWAPSDCCLCVLLICPPGSDAASGACSAARLTEVQCFWLLSYSAWARRQLKRLWSVWPFLHSRSDTDGRTGRGWADAQAAERAAAARSTPGSPAKGHQSGRTIVSAQHRADDPGWSMAPSGHGGRTEAGPPPPIRIHPRPHLLAVDTDGVCGCVNWWVFHGGTGRSAGSRARRVIQSEKRLPLLREDMVVMVAEGLACGRRAAGQQALPGLLQTGGRLLAVSWERREACLGSGRACHLMKAGALTAESLRYKATTQGQLGAESKQSDRARCDSLTKRSVLVIHGWDGLRSHHSLSDRRAVSSGTDHSR